MQLFARLLVHRPRRGVRIIGLLLIAGLGHLMPDDPPPAYTELPENGSVSVDEGVGVPDIRHYDVQTTRPDAESSAASSAAPDLPARPPSGPPPGPPPSSRPPPGPPPSSRPPPGPPPSSRPDKTRPPQGRPPGKPPRHGSHASSHSSGHSAYGPPQQWGPPQGRPHLQYPPNFFCRKCHNTGVKVKKGTSCQDCWDRFGVQTNAQLIPSNYAPVFQMPPRVVRPGDPSIGGVLCGRCRGKGYISDFFSQSSCPICHGVGRVF